MVDAVFGNAEKNRQKTAAKKMKEAMRNGTLNISVPDHDIFTWKDMGSEQ